MADGIHVTFVVWSFMYPWARPLAWCSRTFGVRFPTWAYGYVKLLSAK